MVRCIPTFVILGLIATLTCNHPISIDNVDEIVETVEEDFATPIQFDNNNAVQATGVQSVEDTVYNIVDDDEAVPTTAPFVIENEIVTDNVDIQAVDIEEPTVVEENITAGVQAVEEDIEEDVVAGVQGVEDVDEDEIVVAEATQNPNDDEVVAQAADNQNIDDNEVMEFELFEEGEEADDEMTAAGIIDEEINTVQNSSPEPVAALNSNTASTYENLALEALNKLKILHIFRSSIPYKPNKFYRGMKKLNSDVFDVPVVTEVVDQETDVPEEVPTEQVGLFDVFKPRQNKRCVDGRCEENDAEIALFEVEEDTNNYETVTEMVTEVHVVSAVADDEDQPTIGAIAIDQEPEQDIEEEIPLFGVIEEIDDEEVQIAKKDVFVELTYEIVEISSEQQTPIEDIVISGVLIDLTEQENSSEAVATEAVTDVVEEEPTIIN